MKWPVVRLGTAARQRKEFITIDDEREYLRCRVQLHAQGIVERDRLPGALIKTKQQQVCRAGEFLVAEIDAKHGGYGIVPDALDGAIVSSHYFLFELDQSQLDRQFLDYFAQTPAFLEQVNAQGTTNYAAIRPQQVLDYEIPLPPLAEQRRIVAKIERVAGRVAEAQGLREEAWSAAGNISAVAASTLVRQIQEYKTSSLGSIAEIRSGVTLGRTLAGPLIELPYLRVANVQDGYLDLGDVKTVFVRMEEQEKWLLQTGDVLLTEGGDWDKLGRGTVWRGEIPNCIHQNHIFCVRLDRSRFHPEYVVALTRSPYGKAYFQGASKQTTNLATINRRQLDAFPVYDLPLEKQLQIVHELDIVQAKMQQLRSFQSQTAAELDALLPSVLDRAFRGEL